MQWWWWYSTTTEIATGLKNCYLGTLSTRLCGYKYVYAGVLLGVLFACFILLVPFFLPFFVCLVVCFDNRPFWLLVIGMGAMQELLEDAKAIAVHAHYVMLQLSHLQDATPASPLLMLLRTPLHMQKSTREQGRPHCFSKPITVIMMMMLCLLILLLPSCTKMVPDMCKL